MYLKKIKIGNVELDNNLILAPMAGVTNLPFRIICEKFEPGMVCTEMVSSKAIFYNDQKTRRLLNTEGEKRPISFQIFGSDEETMGYTAKYMSKIADIIDINMGCPAPKVVKNGDGSKLLLDLEKAKRIMKVVVENSSVPVTVKIRKGWDKENIVAVQVAKIAEEVRQLVAKGGKRPHLAAVLVGHDGGSETYVRNKVLACEECGFESTLIRYEENVTEEELLKCVDKLNHDDNVDGFIVQLPLPKHINEEKIVMAVDYKKDVDGFHPINVGRMSIGLPCFISATPLGIMTLLQHYNIDTNGKKCVILGRSNIVGKPMAQLMMQKAYGNATVTVCHSQSKNIKQECREADIIIAAIGVPNFVTADMVKEGAVVIDVGTTRVPDGTRKSGFRLNGDVKFDEVAPKCSYITPVPGGVGPMTICSLMTNTLAAGKKEYYR